MAANKIKIDTNNLSDSIDLLMEEINYKKNDVILNDNKSNIIKIKKNLGDLRTQQTSNMEFGWFDNNRIRRLNTYRRRTRNSCLETKYNEIYIKTTGRGMYKKNK